ncbi:MAG TPA: DUF6544 family protein [bacterium]|nr:DUF6544 family protein [bacterium]
MDELWNSAAPGGRVFRPDQLPGLPEAARRYPEHAIAAGTPLASAVRLRMHGEIKLRSWAPFTAQHVTVWDRGMIWSAVVRMNGLPVRGFDRLVGGQGAMQWRLFGMIPVAAASGPHITRSAAGRIIAESVWLPSALCAEHVAWTAEDASHAWARVTVHGETAQMGLAIDNRGGLKTCAVPRWGNPGGGPFRYVDFGAVAEDERRFGGYTVPSRLRVGWYIGTDRFEPAGEFFRVTIDDAMYR